MINWKECLFIRIKADDKLAHRNNILTIVYYCGMCYLCKCYKNLQSDAFDFKKQNICVKMANFILTVLLHLYKFSIRKKK